MEESSLDVAGFFAGEAIDQRFCPNVTVVILETKRQERNLADDVEQLKTYMLRERCRVGLLFNGREAVWLSLGGEFAKPEWGTERLTDLCQVEERMSGQAWRRIHTSWIGQLSIRLFDTLVPRR